MTTREKKIDASHIALYGLLRRGLRDGDDPVIAHGDWLAHIAAP